MNFDEWYLKTYGINTKATYAFQKPAIDTQRATWEASKAEERERCAKIADGMRMIDKSPIGTLHLVGWNEASKQIAEQIRKGE